MSKLIGDTWQAGNEYQTGHMNCAQIQERDRQVNIQLSESGSGIQAQSILDRHIGLLPKNFLPAFSVEQLYNMTLVLYLPFETMISKKKMYIAEQGDLMGAGKQVADLLC